MSKQTLNISLITIAVVVYGAIAYKYFGGGTKGDLQSIPLNLATNTAPELIKKEHSFKLELTNRDPFLDKTYRRKLASQKRSTQPSSNILPKKQVFVKWPPIQYLGYAKSSSKKDPTAILRVNGKLHRKRKGGFVNKDLKIVEIYEDSIALSLKSKKKYFNRN